MLKFTFWALALLLSASGNFAFNSRTRRADSWSGKWFPSEPTHRSDIQMGSDGRIAMGIINSKCDDGKVNLTVDWDNSFEDYTCTSPRSRYVPNEKTESRIEFENIPKAYLPPHFCMDTEIKYDHPLPSFGAHRPLWPVFGEYKFLPKQRWLHSLEHGGILAVYHPCADLRQIQLLKELVKGCLRRHVITPSRELTQERPFGLLAWGVRYTMSIVYPNAVRQFIKERARKGLEQVPQEGQFNVSLIEKASIVSDFDDSNLCPNQ